MTRLCTFKVADDARLGIALDDCVADLNLARAILESAGVDRASVDTWPTMIDFLAEGATSAQIAQGLEASLLERGKEGLYGPGGARAIYGLDEIKLLAPVPRPPKILCLAGNYAAHVREGPRGSSASMPVDIHVFTKFPGTSVIGHEEQIRVSSTVEKLDYELELGVIIGKRGRYIPTERALEHVGGYTVFNDVCDREYMPSASRSIHWFAMKSQDNFAPMGPYLLLAQDVPDPNALDIKLWVNGELRQDANTADMVFSVAKVVSRLSDFVTLEVGDVIATGTPAGNGWSRGSFLQNGDVVEAQVEGIGLLRNQVAFEEPIYRAG
jgi:2-keto-4-pentenoate hydratase/2-oxohepta-3-ene-1,7-dioic acid hydratase in catechol pathway